MDRIIAEVVNKLTKRGEELLAQPYQKIKFTGDTAADDLLNDLANCPHGFVLACIMDRQIRAERAWSIPYAVSKEIGGFEFPRLLSVDLNRLRQVFTARRLHRFNETMARNFCSAIHLIHREYNDDASSIWTGTPRSATIVRRFLQFEGVGIKIASMAANILARDFKIAIADRLCIDISPDVQVRRVLTRLGLTEMNASNDEIVYLARELNPEYPGILDLSLWEIGRIWCRPRDPHCHGCYLEAGCPKILQ